jgi:acyl-[acyl-carrier-protein]-phospholipid O-acyltransferase/long-chain-fatty-acid--[acyl-carrier-protein] ligase
MQATENRGRRGFWALIATQFQGAFNENGLKSLVVFLILGMNMPQNVQEKNIWVVNSLFTLPFIIFSLTGGFLADRFSKRAVTIATKYFEIAVMLLAIVALAAENLPLSIAAVFLASTQAALFSPSKYGLLPELLPPEKLSWGNGIIELGTFIGIIAGTVGGSFMSEHFNGHHGISGVIFLSCSVVGLVTAYAIAPVPAADPAREFRIQAFVDLWPQIKIIRADGVLWLAVAGNTYFWFLGALAQNDVIFYGKRILQISDTQDGMLLAAIAIGIGLGSLAAGYLSGGKIEYGLIPFGAAGMTIFCFALSVHGLSFRQVLLFLSLLGFSSGFFIVPINALIQHRPSEQHRGRVIAVANLLSFIGIGAAYGVYFLCTQLLKLGPAAIFFWAAVATVAATAYILFLLPDALLRLLLWLATHTIYRVDLKGQENIPSHGGALIVPNHASMVDAVLLIATTDRAIRFLMFRGFYDHWLVKPFAKIMGVIPIASDQGPREMLQSLHAATDALRAGEVVCIFPEGQMTRTGQLLPFRRGMERIVKDVDVPIIPAYIDGIWGSIFSFSGGRFLWKFPRHIPYPVRITYGAPLLPTATSIEARQAVQELGVESFARRKPHMKTLTRSFIQTARRHPLRFAMADGHTPRVNFFSVLVKSLFLARRLRKHWKDQPMVGLLLPPSIPGALVNYAALLMGKIPVNLNYAGSNEALASCAEQCNLKTIVTSRLFVEKVPVRLPGEIIYLEDLAQNSRLTERLAAFLAALLLPAGFIEKFAGASKKTQIDDTATIIFSSGSTGEPKGVVLSHYNIASNVEQLIQVFHLHGNDRILGILPFFHSFGFTGTLCLPAVAAIGVIFHPNPLEAHAIGALVNRHKVTMLLATPTFLNSYARRVEPKDFGSLRIVMAGAEKLPDRISLAFEDHFGIRPLEAYGCTECSPAVAVNTLDFRAADFRQVGAKRGSIGHPLPGIGVRVLHPETRATLGVDEPGLLLVRGPNVMQGYLHQPEKTAEVLVDGWYNTGDIAAVDEDGFIRITDRLSRFSKIGGEMVPHSKIEEKLHQLLEADGQVLAVTAIPDEKKGERLIVLHTLSDEKLAEAIECLAKSDLPALWKPHADQFIHVNELPYLGTGKLDLRRLRELAHEHVPPAVS